MVQSILITGCSSGIGEACACGLKARGWRVFATARKNADLERLESLGLETSYLDYTEAHSIEATVEKVLTETDGTLTALFNNGAYGQVGALEDIRTDVLRAQFEANVFGWHDLTMRLIPAMRRNGGGRIVNCSSVLGLVAMKYRGAYVASKFAIEGLFLTLRQELQESGIFVSLIEPGPISTRFTDHALEAFHANIDIQASHFSDIYEESLGHFQARGANRFTLPPQAVLDKLIHALESPSPKPHYYVTKATHLMAIARRILPSRTLDWLLRRVSDNRI